MIVQHKSPSQSDQHLMSILAHRFRAHHLHVVDLPYRFSSWALDDPDNVRLWFDEAQQLVAWATLQTPFWTIDYAYDPDAGPDLHRHILAWADERAQAVSGSPYGRPAWFINVFDHQTDRIADLEAAGFACQANVPVDPWSKVLLARPAEAPIAENPLPDGFHARPLNGEAEVPAYGTLHRAVFQSTSMTEPWRSRVLRHPSYQPQLDLAVEAPDGKLAAFCVCWFDGENGQVEPLGVGEAYRHLGLGKALLAEGSRRLRALGAKKIYVETDDYRDAAFNLYTSMGFRVQENVLVYRKDYE